MPIDHITINVPPSTFSQVVSFYTIFLAPMDYSVIFSRDDYVGLGYRGRPDFWIGKGKSDDAVPSASHSMHIAFTVNDQKTVETCYEAALKTGAKSNGPPGFRPQYRATYYAAFVFDPLGNNVEVVFDSAEKSA